MADLQLKHRVRAIHEGAVADVIASIDPSWVLGQHLPPVDVREKLLPRPFRTTLAKLRSGFSSAMGDYLFGIGRLSSPLCPECGAADHTVPHIFDCASRPTDLCPADLWERPREAARFISSLPTLAHLPALSPTPPLPEPLPDAPSPPWQGLA